MHFDKISSGVVDLLTIYAFCLTISEAGKILMPTLPRKESIKYHWTGFLKSTFVQWSLASSLLDWPSHKYFSFFCKKCKKKKTNISIALALYYHHLSAMSLCMR